MFTNTCQDSRLEAHEGIFSTISTLLSTTLNTTLEIVTPEWLVKSVEERVLLPWNDFIFRPGDRADDIHGIKTAQKTLLDGFVSQARSRSSPNRRVAESKASTSAVKDPSDEIIPDSQQDTQSTDSLPENPQSALDLLTGPRKSPSKYETLYMTDPATKEEAARVPGYAADKSNPMAQRVMENPQWRSAHTSIAPDFIEGFYKNSRLHHLATWKAELKNLVSEAQDRAESGVPGVTKVDAENNLGQGTVTMIGTELVMKSPLKGKGKQKAETEEKVIMHCDFDSFFVSAGLVDRPHLRGKPVVVCHSQGAQGGGSSTSEIASSSYEARGFGIKNGMRCGRLLALSVS
jgi:DNA repair protein REV1